MSDEPAVRPAEPDRLDDDVPMTDLVLHRSGPSPDAAPVLLLLHGATDSGPSWADAIERWSSIYHVVAADARGHGDSPRFTDADAERPPSDVMADDAIAILRELHEATGRRTLVVGHSMGARVAGLVSEREPALVAAAVLEDPPWRLPPDASQPDSDQRERARTDPEPEASVEEMVDRQRLEAPAWPESELRPWAEAKGRTDPRAVDRSRPPSRSWVDTATALSVPTLLVTGDGAVIVGPEARAELAESAPQIQIVVVVGADHCVRRDQGDAYHAAVDPFLAAHAPVVAAGG